MVTRALSIEDGQLNRRALVTTRTRDYSDIDLTFAARPSGDVYKKIDAAAVKQSVKNILLTNRFERPFNPFFGSDLQQMLFELAVADNAEFIKDDVTTAINRYEPRAQLLEVESNVSPDQNTVYVRVVFQVVNTEEQVTITTSFTRVR